MAKIDLLPKELAPKKNLYKIADIVTKIAYAMGGILLISIIVLVVIFILYLGNIKSLKGEESDLQERVKSYEQTEQQITLAKDRIASIKEIWAMKNITTSLPKIKEMFSFIDENTSLKNLKATANGIEVSIDSLSANSTAAFLGKIISSKIFNSVILKTFSFNPNYGFRIVLEVTLK
jgi:Tfp pilus assembly protein PilN